MKLISMLSLLLSSQLGGYQEWVKIGEAEINWGYKTPYRINLLTPKGIHDLDDVRNAMQPLQFDLEWLAPITSKEQVEAHFKELLENQFSTPDSIKFNQITINRFVSKLPEASRFDRWYFYFSPDSGTQIYIDDTKRHTIIGAEINRALHHAWLFKDPVTTSKLLTRLLKLGK